MKKWRIGAILGATGGISILILPLINVTYLCFVGQRFISPTPSLDLAIVFYSFLSLPIIFGALIGAGVGLLIEDYRR